MTEHEEIEFRVARRDRFRTVILAVAVLILLAIIGFGTYSIIARGQQAQQNAVVASTNKEAADKLCDQVKALGRECAVNPTTLPTPASAPAPIPGIKGDKGDTGNSGQNSTTPGPTGKPGPIGPSGPAGPKGDPGEDGLDPACMQAGQGNCIGPQGQTGPKGDTGATGPAGPECRSGYTAQDRTQVDGEVWLVCVKDAPPPTAAGVGSTGTGILFLASLPTMGRHRRGRFA